jgi:hypothetical protein
MLGVSFYISVNPMADTPKQILQGLQMSGINPGNVTNKTHHHLLGQTSTQKYDGRVPSQL